MMKFETNLNTEIIKLIVQSAKIKAITHSTLAFEIRKPNDETCLPAGRFETNQKPE